MLVVARCRPAGAGVHALRLIEELGLEGEVEAASEHSKTRFIWHNGHLRVSAITIV